MKRCFLTLWVLAGIAFPLACSKNNNPISPVLTATPVPTATIWANYTTTNTATSTPTSSATATNVTSTFTPTLTITNTYVGTATFSFTYTSTATPTGTPTSTPTSTPYNSPNNSPTPFYINSGPSVIQYPNGLAYGLALGTSGAANFYVAQGDGASNNSVQILNAALSSVGSITSFGATAFGSTDGVAVNPLNGNIYVVDSVNNAVYEFTSAGVTVASWSSWSGGTVTSFETPTGIAVDKSGNIYVADMNNNTVEEFTTSGSVVTYVNQWNTGTTSFSIPSAVAVDGSNNLYVADAGNELVQILNGTWSSWSTIPGSDIFGISVDSNGNVYTADPGNGLVEEYTNNGSLETLWDGLNGDFIDPDGVLVVSGGNIFVTDYSGPNGTGSLQEFGP